MALPLQIWYLSWAPSSFLYTTSLGRNHGPGISHVLWLPTQPKLYFIASQSDFSGPWQQASLAHVDWQSEAPWNCNGWFCNPFTLNILDASKDSTVWKTLSSSAAPRGRPWPLEPHQHQIFYCSCLSEAENTLCFFFLLKLEAWLSGISLWVHPPVHCSNSDQPSPLWG